MNLFELLTVLVVIGAGYLVGRYLGAMYGLLGWLGGVVSGVAGATAVYLAFRRLIGISRKNRSQP